jgi:hypothetical protein
MSAMVLLLGGGCIVPGIFGSSSGEVASTSSTTTDADALDPNVGDTATTGGGPMSTDTSDASTGPDDNRDPRPPPPPNRGDCCEPSRGTGCGDDAIEACVCAADPQCCSGGWDELCVDHVEELACGGCSFNPAGTRGVGECCAAHGEAGCIDDAIAQCVCAQDPYCCDVAWDQVCVDAIDGYACGACPGPFMPADCCTPGEVGGCPDPDITACVCEQDAYCCDDHWDELCVDQANAYCGGCFVDVGTTGEPVPPGECCEIGEGPGCLDADITMCVCAIDPYCCEQAWDGTCIIDVDMLGCGVCDPQNGSSTSGESSSSGDSMTY